LDEPGVTAVAPAAADETTRSPVRVAYLLGAGATQAAVAYAGSSQSLVMPGLIQRLRERMREVYVEHFSSHPGMRRLVNEVVSDNTDFEHLLTFLEDAPSGQYKEFAGLLKDAFSTVLRSALDKARSEAGDEYSYLYAALVDMHHVSGAQESLAGFLTLNYDSFLEHAIEERLGFDVDYGVHIRDTEHRQDAIPVLKLHGSFSWRHTWPIEVGDEVDAGIWIPPGIRKAKGDYPFNAIWGAAREILDCEILRIVGCNLGPNDWDLVSLLFTTMHGRESAPPYEVEVIASPATAVRIATALPYLSPRSLLEIDEIGPQLVAEVLDGEPVPFQALDGPEQVRAVKSATEKISSPFERWLRLKGELMVRDLPELKTEKKIFKDFIERSDKGAA
jgi:hypothetical protein